MGIFASLLAAVTGNRSSSAAPAAPAPASAAKPPDGFTGADAGRFIPVQSSNVKAIRWVPMAVVKRLDTKLIGTGGQVATGPLGGLLPQGGVRVDGTVTAQTVTGYRGEFAAPDQPISESTMGTLSVMFLSGAIYEYLDVPRKIFTEMSQAASKGRYVWQVLYRWPRQRRAR